MQKLLDSAPILQRNKNISAAITEHLDILGESLNEAYENINNINTIY